jgi:hypothetical protein
MSKWMKVEWEHIKKIGNHFYTHLSNYFTTVKREAERKQRMMERYPGMIVKIVHRKVVGGDGKTRTVYTLYTREEK